MKLIKRLISMSLAVVLVTLIAGPSIAEVNKTLLLTGDLYSYSYNDNEYVLNVMDANMLRSLDGKKIGFKIKTVDDQKITEEETQILGVRCETIKDNNSRLIFNAMQSMMVASEDNKYLTFKIGASGSEDSFDRLQSLLNKKLKNNIITVIITYYDNRISGDSTLQAKVVYKFGQMSSRVNSSSGFVVDKPEVDNKDKVTSKEEKKDIIKKINRSSIISELKDKDKVVVKLDESSETVVPVSLLKDLMWTNFQDKTLVIEKYNNGSFAYRWTIPVNNINREEKFDINISDRQEEVDRIAKTKFERYKIISFDQKGTLPVIGEVELPIDSRMLEGSKLKIYSVNLDKKILEEIRKEVKVKEGLLILENVGYGDNYIVVGK